MNFTFSPRNATNNPRYAPLEEETHQEDAVIEDITPESNAVIETTPEVEETANVEEGMELRVLDLNGKVYFVRCLPECKISELKGKISGESGVREGLQRLIYRGQVLDDGETVIKYKLEDGQTIHLFARQEVSVPVETTSTSAEETTEIPYDENMLFHGHIGPINDTISAAAVFPSDGRPRVDPLMLDTPLGNCARRVKLWSSFLLIIYTMKVLSQFALLANVREEEFNDKDDGSHHSRYNRPYYSPYYDQDPIVSALEMGIHAFGVYVGCLGFKAAHDTDIRQVRAYCTGILWLAIFTIFEQIYITFQIAHSDYPKVRDPTHRIPSLNDVVTANILQTGVLTIMWAMAVHHAHCHRNEVLRYNETFTVAVVNPVIGRTDPPVESSEATNGSTNEEVPASIEPTPSTTAESENDTTATSNTVSVV